MSRKVMIQFMVTRLNLKWYLVLHQYAHHTITVRQRRKKGKIEKEEY